MSQCSLTINGHITVGQSHNKNNQHEQKPYTLSSSIKAQNTTEVPAFLNYLKNSYTLCKNTMYVVLGSLNFRLRIGLQNLEKT